MIKLTLPYPVSSNRYWRSFVPRGHSRANVTLSDEAKAYKRQVQRAAVEAGILQPINCRVALHLQLYPARPLNWARRARKDPAGWDDEVRCIDLGNCEKVVSDALNGVAWVDDRQHRRIVLERMEPDGEARVVVTIEPLARALLPQLDLLGEAA